MSILHGPAGARASLERASAAAHAELQELRQEAAPGSLHLRL